MVLWIKNKGIKPSLSLHKRNTGSQKYDAYLTNFGRKCLLISVTADGLSATQEPIGD